MDLREEVRRRIADLTRLAYERGYRDGAQSALAEIESLSADDLADQLKELSEPIKALPETVSIDDRQPAEAKRRKTKQAKAKRPNAKLRKAKRNDAAPKAATVQQCIQALIASKGEAPRDEILAAARAENEQINSRDVSNGIRTLIRRKEIRVAPQDSGRLLPTEAMSEQA